MPRKGKMTEVVSQVKSHSLSRTDTAGDESSRVLIPTGSTLLNLAVSGKAFGGWGAGKMVNLVGDSNTGKTLVVLTGLMEMTLDEEAFGDYDLRYDDAENALEMDIKRMFGPKLYDRLTDPYGKKISRGETKSSVTIEDFRNNVWRCLEEGRKFVYILDTYDGLTSRAELKRQEEESKGHEQSADFSRGPAILGETLRKISSRIKETDSLVIIISQTRDAMNAMFAAQKRRAGGRALKFFSSHEVWMAIIETLSKEIRGSKRTIGHMVRARSERSKLTGKRRDIDLTIFSDYGVDDTGSCIEWLLKNGIWKGTRQAIDSKGFMRKMSKDEMISLLESVPDGTHNLKGEMQLAWNEIEGALKIDRPARWQLG